MKIKVTGVKLVSYDFNGKKGVSQQVYFLPLDATKGSEQIFGTCPEKMKVKDIHSLFGVQNMNDPIGRTFEVFFDQYKNAVYGREIK